MVERVTGTRVIHHHKVGSDFTFCRVSELVFIEGRPRAILGWIETGGARVPLYTCDMDPAKLRRVGEDFYYDDVTVDPRYEEENP